MNKLILLIAGVGGTALSATQLLLIFGVVFLHTQPAYSDETDAWKADYVIVYHGSSRSLRNLVSQGPNRAAGKFFVTPDISTACRAAHNGPKSGVIAYCVPKELAPEILGEEKLYMGLYSDGSSEYRLSREQAMKLHEYMHPDCKIPHLRPRIRKGILNPLPRVKPRSLEYPVDRLMMDEHFFNEIDWAILTGRHPSLLDEVLFEEAPGLKTPFVRSELPHGHLSGGVECRPPSGMPSVSPQRPSRLSTSWLRGAQWFGFVYEAKHGKIEPDTTIPSGPAANLYEEFRRFSLNRIKQMGRCSGYDEDAQIQQGIIDQNRLHFFRVDSHLRAFKELDAFQQKHFQRVTDFPIIP